MSKKITLSMLIVILSIINFSIYDKESHLKKGETLYFALAPVDPRSLMQGDYMALRFAVSTQIYQALPKMTKANKNRKTVEPHNGKIVISLSEKAIGTFQAIYTGQTLHANEITVNYRVRDNKVKLASNAFFFEEGNAKHYEKSQYGQFKVNKKGELLLKAMVDEHLIPINP